MPTTDSAWIPLFFRASGLVVEVGGVLSHGAIIARELGIPTVTNVRGATSQVESGQVITVDGGSGTVLLPVEQQEATI
ncbi:MAG: pyruvate, water dikinase [Chloroflexaceae bacterium]|nr:pyruvate, water dikinase [Chloroflexaceae bacterium]